MREGFRYDKGAENAVWVGGMSYEFDDWVGRYNTEEWWWGVICILFSLGVLKMVPAASKRGVCFRTPTALTAAEKWGKCPILIGTGRYAE